MNPSNPFQISKNDVERSSTLTKRDIGKWAYTMNGCVSVVGTKEQAEQVIDSLRNWNKG